MSDHVIQIDQLGKKFRRGARPAYGRFSELLVNGARESVRWALNRACKLFSRSGDNSVELAEHEFWALRDVSFDVRQGEVLGIIGRNGAGKSTLLKLLSRITRPTTGEIRLRGRVGSLLEVGTGFHPELTGRENVYLNGTILGMRKAEIDRKFDEIVAFAEIEQFLDTPVKHYSSGMYMRLAFAVAAHLEPEILVVDEVLAVGDAQFQKKCLGKMGEAARGGRTILFVTHNMAALRQLCPRAIRLHQGRIHREGPSQAIVEEYLAEGVARVDLHDLRAAIRALPPDPAFELLDVSLTQDGGVPTAFLNGEPIDVTIHYRIVQPTHGVRIYIDLCDEDQDLLIRSFDDELDESPHARQPGQYAAVVQIPADLLSPRDYTLMVHATIHNVRSLTGEGLAVPLKVEHTSRINGAYPHEPIRGRLLPPMRWATHAVEDARV